MPFLPLFFLFWTVQRTRWNSTHGRAIDTLISRFIRKHQWTISSIGENIRTINQTRWIRACPPSYPRRVVAHTVVVQSILFVSLLATVAVMLWRNFDVASNCLIGRAAVGVIFLVGDDLSFIVQLQTG